VKSSCNFHISGSMLFSVRDLCVMRLGMVEIIYTQVFVEKYLEKPCVGVRILVIKCHLMTY
jgi:hypothetical protein